MQRLKKGHKIGWQKNYEMEPNLKEKKDFQYEACKRFNASFAITLYL